MLSYEVRENLCLMLASFLTGLEDSEACIVVMVGGATKLEERLTPGKTLFMPPIRMNKTPTKEERLKLQIRILTLCIQPGGNQRTNLLVERWT